MATAETGREVADGVYRFGSERVNWYLLEDDGGLTVVDAGFPAHWEQLVDHLGTTDRTVADVDACVVTHAHPDHIGFAHRLHEEAGVPVWLHEAGVRRAREAGDPPLAAFVRNLWRPAIVRYMIEVVRSGGTSVPPVTSVETFVDGDELDVPGRPRVLHVPGHTEDEVALHLPDRDVLLCGDALATVEFETWRGHVPRLMPAWLNVDHGRARSSLDGLDSLGEVTLLPGHGDPWTGRTAEAVRRARESEGEG